jgi:hypothetical protein
MVTGTCTVHSWNDKATEDEGMPELGTSFDEELHYSREYNDFRANAIRREGGRNRRDVTHGV